METKSYLTKSLWICVAMCLCSILLGGEESTKKGSPNQASTENLFPNPSFEQAFDDPQRTHKKYSWRVYSNRSVAVITRDKEEVADGEWSVFIEGAGDYAGLAILLGSDLGLQRGKRYQIRFKYKTRQKKGYASYRIFPPKRLIVESPIKMLPPAEDWCEEKFILEMPEQGQIECTFFLVAVKQGEGDMVWFDSTHLELLPEKK